MWGWGVVAQCKVLKMWGALENHTDPILFMMIYLVGFPKDNRHCLVVMGETSFQENRWPEGLWQIPSMPVTEAYVVSCQVGGTGRISHRFVGRSMKLSTRCHNMASTLFTDVVVVVRHLQECVKEYFRLMNTPLYMVTSGTMMWRVTSIRLNLKN